MAFLFVATNAASFGFRTCTRDVDDLGPTEELLVLDYQWNEDRYTCEISSALLYDEVFSCDTASIAPTGPCDGDNFLQINKVGTDDVCIAAIIVDGQEIAVQAQRLGNTVNAGTSPDQSEGIAEVYKRRYTVSNGAAVMTLPSGYESTALVAIECTAYVFDHELYGNTKLKMCLRKYAVQRLRPALKTAPHSTSMRFYWIALMSSEQTRWNWMALQPILGH